MDAVFYGSEATGNDRMVLLAIADEAHDNGAGAYPSIKRIALKTKLTERSVQRCLRSLEVLEELIIIRPKKQGRGHHNTYCVPVENLIRRATEVAPFRFVKGAEGRQDARETIRARHENVADPITHRPLGVASLENQDQPLPVEENLSRLRLLKAQTRETA